MVPLSARPIVCSAERSRELDLALAVPCQTCPPIKVLVGDHGPEDATSEMLDRSRERGLPPLHHEVRERTEETWRLIAESESTATVHCVAGFDLGGAFDSAF